MVDDNTSSGQYSRPPSYPLSGLQRAYVSDGETGNYREAKLEQDVQKKIDQLGERFNRLFSDAELLYENGYLDEKHYADAWADLLGFDENDKWAEILNACHLHADIEGARPTSAPQKTARKFGQLLFMLMLYPDEAGDPERIEKELAWGFLHGLCLDPLDGAPLGEVRRDAIEGTIEYLGKRLENELEYDERVISSYKERQDQMEASMEREQAVRDRIREVLDGIEGVEPQGKTRSETYPSGIDAYTIFALLIDRVTEDPTPEEEGPEIKNITGSVGQQVLFERQHGPLSEININEIVTRETVLAVLKEYNLATKAEIAEKVYEDVEMLEDAGGYKGVDAAAEVVKIIHDEEKPNSAHIAREVATESHKGSVTALCKCLSGRTRLTGQEELADRTEDRPIVTGAADGWGLSIYGEFVAEELAAREKWKRSSRAELESSQFQVGPGADPSDFADRVAEAADEIGLEMWEYSRKD